MLEKDRFISELYELEHRHDSKTNKGFNYSNNLLKRTTSPYMWQNDNMNSYLTKLEECVSVNVEQMDYARNFFNYTVDKFYNDYYG